MMEATAEQNRAIDTQHVGGNSFESVACASLRGPRPEPGQTNFQLEAKGSGTTAVQFGRAV
jgi:hypothetical protein